jgi:LCP family protein required for cell wall assembly
VLAVVMTAALVPATGLVMTERLADDVKRIPDPFATVPEATRPDKAVDSSGRAPVTFLVAGVDIGSETPTTGTYTATSRRGLADAVLLVHLSGDRKRAYVVSIPRDTWVSIPGRGQARINEAYGFGGPSMLATTVERITDVRVDHVAVVDFTGFRALTDALGGVTVTISKDSYDPYRNRVWHAGTQHLDGEAALAYVRQRKGLPRDDLDRTQRHQAYLRAVLNRLIETRTLANPVRLSQVAEAIGQTVRVDANLSNSEMRDLLFGLRVLDPDRVLFATAPVARPANAERNVVQLDLARAQPFWDAFENDELAAHVARFSADTLGPIEN